MPAYEMYGWLEFRRVPSNISAGGRSRRGGRQLLGGLLAAAADQDRQSLLDRPRTEGGVLELVVLAGVGDLALVEEAALDTHRLAELREPDRRGVEVDPVHLVFVFVPRRADAEDGPPVRDVVERRRHVREDR